LPYRRVSLAAYKVPSAAPGISRRQPDVEVTVSLKDLSDSQLRAFIEDPKTFLSDEANYKLVFDLDDALLRAKVERFEKELGLDTRNIVERIEDAK
jgi:hypothetical protein